MMWPVGEFYDGSNELDADKLRMAAIFCKRGYEDLADYMVKGRTI
jgi:hypothetical protein